jgi:glycosyltransferase involved in cell wall biosynthesis
MEAVQSVFAQDYPHWELLLIDDGSNDGSLQLVERINDPRVRLIHDGVNRGLISRLNQIPTLAQGHYIARMDGDDMMLPNRISEQVDFLEQNKQWMGVDSAAYTIDQSNHAIGIRGQDPMPTDPFYILTHCRSIHGTVLARAEWFLQNPYDPRFVRAEDYELWCRTALNKDFGRIQKPLYLLREGQVSISNYKKSMHTLRKIFEQYGPLYTSSLIWKKEKAKTYLKTWMYQLFGLMGQQHQLSSRRNRPLSVEEKEEVKQIIFQIKNQPIPGI